MSHSDDGPTIQSMRHKRILDVAEEHPKASMSKLASLVPSATTDLVERVLDEYGDPAVEGTAENSDDEASADRTSEPVENGDRPVPSETGSQSGHSENGTTPNNSDTGAGSGSPDKETGSEPWENGKTPAVDPSESTGPATTAPETTTPDHPSPEELTAEEREVLRTIAENPDAIQKELAEEIGVSRSTISNRVNGIDGFEWKNRRRFVAAVFDTDLPASFSGSGLTPSNHTDGHPDPERLEERVSELERRIERLDGSATVFGTPELTHKVVHACLQAETIAQEEELRILKHLLDD